MIRVTGISAGYPQRLGAKPYDFVSRLKRRLEQLSDLKQIKAELANARAVFHTEYGCDLDVSALLEDGRQVS